MCWVIGFCEINSVKFPASNLQISERIMPRMKTNVNAMPAPELELLAPRLERSAEVLTPAALDLVVTLHRKFNGRRLELLATRAQLQKQLDAGGLPEFLPETAATRAGAWRVAPAPADLADRRVEITGPVDRKMVINALNAPVRAFMADFEDSCSPTWDNVIRGQVNLNDAVRGTISHEDRATGKVYRLAEHTATLIVRPRGWHLPEKHLRINGEAVSGALCDFALFLANNCEALARRGTGPYFYLPKIESHLEARLWNEVFVAAQERLGIPRGTIRATVLIETYPAAFEMEEILYELREHSAGLNAGRWDFMFSVIKKFRTRGRDFLLPDRNSVTMTAPFLRAYTELLVRTCHKRGAHAIGGMAAFIPSRRDPQVNATALAKVREDKLREAGDGFDGSWVAHPDLVPVCREVFDGVLGDRPNQLDRTREDVRVTAAHLLDVRDTPGQITEAGLRGDISVGIQYLASWLRGTGAVAINNLMEDAATAEISRSQVWQWLHNDVTLAGGQQVTRDLVEQIIGEELGLIREQYGAAFDAGQFDQAVALFTEVALADDYAEFLTIPAYERMP